MSKIIIVYASLTGNTEEMAELIAEGVRSAGAAADLKMVEDCSAVQLLEYDGYMLGAYTWGDGELPDEFEDFVDEMKELDLRGAPRRYSAAAIRAIGCTAEPWICWRRS